MKVIFINSGRFDELIEALAPKVCKKAERKLRKKCAKESKPNKSERRCHAVNACRETILNIIAGRKGWTTDDVNKWLYKISQHYPMAAAHIVLMEVAKHLDHKYEGTINKCPFVFTIGSVDGKIHKIDTNEVKCFRNFAAFRTREDAQFAKEVVSMRKLFRGSGK